MDAVIKVKLDERARKYRADWIGWVLGGAELRKAIGYWSECSWDDDENTWAVHIPDPDPSDRIDGFLINERFASRAFDLMVGLYGMHWYGKADASKYDEAIQLAAFGKRVFA